MHGMAAYFQAKPDHADLRAYHSAGGRLGYETGVGTIAAMQSRERADASAFLLDHRLEVNPCGRFQSSSLDGIKRVKRTDGTGFHVAGAATVHPPTLYDRRERRRLPHLQRSGRHDVTVTLQDQ